MTDVTDPFVVIIAFALRVFAILCLCRFAFQLVKVDAYNPLTGAVVRITDPLLKPIRSVLPRSLRIDLASILVASLSYGVVYALHFMSNEEVSSIVLKSFGLGFYEAIDSVLWIFVIAIFIVVVASWFAPRSSSPGLLVARSLADPLLRKISQLLPPMGGLDLSPMVVMLTFMLIRQFIMPPLRAILSGGL